MADSPDMAEARPAPTVQRRTLLGVMLLLIVAAILLLLPLWPWILLALWTASIVNPLFQRLSRVVHGRSRAAGLVTVALLIAVMAPVAAGVAVVAPQAVELVQRAIGSDSGRGALVELVSARGQQQGKADPAAKAEQLVEMVEAHGQQAWTVAALLASVVGSVLFGVVTYFVGTYAALIHGKAAYLWLCAQLPLEPARTDRLRDAFQETGRGLLFSVVLTALVQAGLATIAYVSLGVPRALVLGLATFVTSVIPAIGPFLVWGPVAFGLLLAGAPIKAAILAGVCAIIVAPADNLLRPLFAKLGKLTLHPYLVFFSMLGGIVTLGGWGLMLGPLVYRMALELIAMVREQRALLGGVADADRG
ncbi:MAG TPA: AI-2E family transporter [Polyangiales bacterium]